MTDSNRTRLSLIRESTFGETPSSPTMQRLPFNSSSLTASPNTIASEEIRDDRSTADLFLVGVDASGDMTTEMRSLAFETLIEGAMFNDWQRRAGQENTTQGDTVTIDSGDDVVVPSGGEDFAVGDIVRLSGFRNSANNQQFVVSASTDTSITGATGTVEETDSPVGARVKNVGFRGDSGDLSLTASPAKLVSASEEDFTTIPGLVVGTWIKLGGSATANKFDTEDDNGYYRISSISATELTFDRTPQNFAEDAGTGKEIDVFIPDYIRNGTKNYSHTLEQSYLEISKHQYFRGMVVESMELSMESQSIIDATFNFTGKEGEYQDSELSGITRYDKQARTALNTSSNVGQLNEGGSPVEGPNFILSADVTIANNLRARNAIGSLGAVSVGAGRSEITGSLSTLFGDLTLLNKVINNTDTSLTLSLKDNGGAVVFLDLPRIKLSEGGTPIQGSDQDVLADLSYQAILDPVLQFQMQMLAFDSVE